MVNPLKVAFYTLGCKLNFAETSAIEQLFIDAGFQKVDFRQGTDVYVINTCSVTASADKKCRNIISRANRLSPNAYIAVIGCYSQLKPGEIAGMPGVDLVLGSEEKFRILELAGEFRKKSRPAICSGEIEPYPKFYPSYSVSGRTRAFLKIQDGCDYFCTYCVIPHARGRSRSASLGEILEQAGKIAGSGVKEVVLTGVNIGDFGKPNSSNLLQLLQQLDKHTDIERFRLSSIEPDLLSDDIIALVAASQKFAPHFHLPLQSGCDRILKEMNRKYCRSLFSDRAEKIRKEIPIAGIGADVITGFPGETERDFEETCDFLAGTDIGYLHVFSYSDRDSTLASGLPGKVSPEEKMHRSRILHKLSEDKLRNFQKRCSGQVHRVLFESFDNKERISGFTGNYLKVEAPRDENLINRLVDVELTGIGEDGRLRGTVKKYDNKLFRKSIV